MQSNPSSTAPRERRRLKRSLLAGACIAVIVLVVLGVKTWMDGRAPSLDADAGRLSRYMASPAFAALPDDQKAGYRDAWQRAHDRLNKNPVQKYVALATKEREKFLDDVIDRVLREDKPRAETRPGPNDKPTDIGGRIDKMPPEDRARMAQFMQDLHDRRVARGLPDDGKFLFNRTP